MIIAKTSLWTEVSCAARRNQLSSSIKQMGYTSSKAGPALYYRARVKKDGEKYYEYLLV